MHGQSFFFSQNKGILFTLSEGICARNCSYFTVGDTNKTELCDTRLFYGGCKTC